MISRRRAFTACFLAALMISLCSPGNLALAQRSSGEKANIDPLYLIDTPVAGVLPATAGSVECTMYPGGGMLLGVVYGMFPNVNVGMSYGATGLIGTGNVIVNDLPGFFIRYRVIEESHDFPALAIGFDSQGRDGWLPGSKQYVFKSPGVYLVASKNYSFWGTVSFHGGMNYTFERHDGDESPSVFAGFEKSVFDRISIMAEYDFAFDNDRDAKGFWNGNFAAGVRVSTDIGVNIGYYFKNLLTSKFYHDKVIRELYVQYVRYI